MNVKKTLAGLVAGFALVGTLCTPALAEPSGTATTATVVVGTGGVFDVRFCGALSLTEVSAPTAASPGYAQGSLSICYDDTKNYRSSFNIGLESDNLTSGANTIPASNLKVIYTYNVAEGQWTSGSPVRIGDIGYFVNGVYAAQNNAGAAWTANNSLDQQRVVNFGYSGIGTIWSRGDMEVGLTIPAMTQPGNYQSHLTLSVLPGTQP